MLPLPNHSNTSPCIQENHPFFTICVFEKVAAATMKGGKIMSKLLLRHPTPKSRMYLSRERCRRSGKNNVPSIRSPRSTSSLFHPLQPLSLFATSEHSQTERSCIRYCECWPEVYLSSNGGASVVVVVAEGVAPVQILCRFIQCRDDHRRIIPASRNTNTRREKTTDKRKPNSGFHEMENPRLERVERPGDHRLYVPAENPLPRL